nr:DUF3365 domain-containing protein [uncultured Desulfobacter sp.]
MTLVNPAYMTRQVHELSQSQYGVKGHITSLNLIRPENKPDSWEKKALEAFDAGKKEVSSVDVIEGEDYFRLMRPMIVEKGCLKCHGYQDYQVGDIRGGVSVSVPFAPYYAIASDRISKTIFVHFTILILGLLGLGGAFFVINKSSRERLLAESRFERAIEMAIGYTFFQGRIYIKMSKPGVCVSLEPMLIFQKENKSKKYCRKTNHAIVNYLIILKVVWPFTPFLITEKILFLRILTKLERRWMETRVKILSASPFLTSARVLKSSVL